MYSGVHAGRVFFVGFQVYVSFLFLEFGSFFYHVCGVGCVFGAY